MYSEDHPSTPDKMPLDSEPIPKLQRQTIHPDSLKFMDMAKDLLDSPAIQQATQGEHKRAGGAGGAEGAGGECTDRQSF